MIARVFPRRTRATPTDEYTFTGEPTWFLPLISEVHVSVAFTYDLPRAEKLARAWERVAPVKIGGPATGMPGGDFIPGRYLAEGYVITSRGCPNRCWFCSVPKREGGLRELPIREGWNVLDDNLLACSDDHIRAVFMMLRGVRHHRVEFTGGLEAARLKPWHAESLHNMQSRFFSPTTRRTIVNRSMKPVRKCARPDSQSHPMYSVPMCLSGGRATPLKPQTEGYAIVWLRVSCRVRCSTVTRVESGIPIGRDSKSSG
jgi:hypothetical protein